LHAYQSDNKNPNVLFFLVEKKKAETKSKINDHFVIWLIKYMQHLCISLRFFFFVFKEEKKNRCWSIVSIENHQFEYQITSCIYSMYKNFFFFCCCFDEFCCFLNLIRNQQMNKFNLQTNRISWFCYLIIRIVSISFTNHWSKCSPRHERVH